MRTRIILLLIMLLSLTTVSTQVQAGFLVRKHAPTAATDSIATSTEATHTRNSEWKENSRQALHMVKNYVKARHDGNNGKGHRDDSGWEGIVALICGILGFFTGWLCIPAIVFGALGLHKRHSGMAKAGLILGIIVAALIVLWFVFVGVMFGLLFA